MSKAFTSGMNRDDWFPAYVGSTETLICLGFPADRGNLNVANENRSHNVLFQPEHRATKSATIGFEPP